MAKTISSLSLGMEVQQPLQRPVNSSWAVFPQQPCLHLLTSVVLSAKRGSAMTSFGLQRVCLESLLLHVAGGGGKRRGDAVAMVLAARLCLFFLSAHPSSQPARATDESRRRRRTSGHLSGQTPVVPLVQDQQPVRDRPDGSSGLWLCRCRTLDTVFRKTDETK